jgi:TPR repeat protein
MFAARTVSFPSLLVAALVSVCASACATGELFTSRVDVAGVKYDPQECVENALRNAPNPGDVRDAAPAFASACEAGEASSCSVLGVMYELGRGFPIDTPRAMELYDAACDAHNPRACANRDRLLLRDGTDAREPALVGQRVARSERGSGG